MQLSAIVGLMHVQENGPVLTARDVEALNGPNGIIYVVGQIDYEQGAIDFCGFFLPAQSVTASLCVNHNGPSQRNVVRP
jgi:hypothetical protein